jgi:acetylornithine deacetylase/succinyl-diaminopimelate desuccinylase-like protein
MSDLKSVIDNRLDNYLADLFEILSQPSISTTGEGMESCAELLFSLIDNYGFDRTEQIETKRYPIVFAENAAKNSAPVVTFYGHYDVQPPGATDEWESPPFEPTVRDDSIYARGAGDNKGQFLSHLFALDALDYIGEDQEVTVQLIIEGGEESGSAGLIEYLRGDPAEIRETDLIYVADGPMHASRRPTIIYGNRGNISFQMDLQTAQFDLHSGNFGGPVPNAANQLVEVLSTMYDGEKVTIKGFHDNINISDADYEMVDSIPVDEESLKSYLNIDQFTTDTSYYKQLLLEPTLTINGLSSGYQDVGKKTIIPHQATAKLDSRLVPDQNPNSVFDRIVEHVKSVNRNIEVTMQGSFPPMKTPPHTAAASPLMDAMKTTWGVEPIEMPLLGGSLPAAHFRSELNVPVLVVPYANPDQGNHSPNEHIDMDCFRYGIETTARFLQNFSTH